MKHVLLRRLSATLGLVLTLLCAGSAWAQETPSLVVMNLAAHPDDEDGSTLAYYRKAKDAVAYSVIFTRGEGGQNEIGPELYEALGAIRTDETERAARHLGTQVQFLNYYDFGYSKEAAEAFEMWGGREAVTARLVYLIRKLKPDVLFTNHDTVTVGERRQHGQHQAVGISAYDAFALAADPAFHPEQLAEPGVDLWQPRRLFLRLWFWNEDVPHDVAVPVGALNPATGEPYTAAAADALIEHASQGMGQWAERIRAIEENRFKLLRTATDAPLDPSDLAGNLATNDAATPDLSYLIDAGRVPALPEGTYALDADAAVPGQSVRLTWEAPKLPARRLRWRFTGAVDTTLHLSDTTPGRATLLVAAGAKPSEPKAVYQYERFTNHPPVTYALYDAATDDLLAAGYLPLEVAPPLFVEANAGDVMRLRPGKNALPVRVQVFDPAAKRITLNAAVSRDADRTVIVSTQADVEVNGEGEIDRTLDLDLPAGLAPGTYTVSVTALGAPATRTPQPAVDHLPARVFSVKVPEGLRVGVVESYDNTLSQALGELGIKAVLLDSLALAEGSFNDLQTIVIDIRAYLVRPGLRAHNDRLLDWVQGGGHLVVNYQKTFEWNPQYDDPFVAGQKNPEGFAPYPLTLGRDRVTREDAPVKVLLPPDHPLLTWPNNLDATVWDGWVQERGLYFPESYDEQYQELFCMSDPAEAPLCSSTLLAEVGAGTYLYTALVWYRQLKAFSPGAYAFFANLMSLPLADASASGRTN